MGREIEDQLFSQLQKVCGMCGSHTTQYNPQGNWQVKLFHRTLSIQRSVLRTLTDNEKVEWKNSPAYFTPTIAIGVSILCFLHIIGFLASHPDSMLRSCSTSITRWASKLWRLYGKVAGTAERGLWDYIKNCWKKHWEVKKQQQKNKHVQKPYKVHLHLAIEFCCAISMIEASSVQNKWMWSMWCWVKRALASLFKPERGGGSLLCDSKPV